MSKKTLVCYQCGAKIEFEGKIFRQSTCPECESYLHCCLNCDNYDTLAAHDCRESQAQWARDKEAANFCDYFDPVIGEKHHQNRSHLRQNDAKSKLEAMFKNIKPDQESDLE